MHTTNKNNNFHENKTIFGFWLYIMSDCILFASLFAMHIVLSNNDMFISSSKHIINLTLVFIETCCLLLSSFTCSKSIIYANTVNIKNFITWIITTLLLGLCFISIEIYEFYHLIELHFDPCRNSYFSSFFILVGTHGIHVIAGLIWIIIMIIHIIMKGFTCINVTRLQCLNLFWHFLDIIWICVFTEVYLIGEIL